MDREVALHVYVSAGPPPPTRTPPYGPLPIAHVPLAVVRHPAGRFTTSTVAVISVAPLVGAFIVMLRCWGRLDRVVVPPVPFCTAVHLYFRAGSLLPTRAEKAIWFPGLTFVGCITSILGQTHVPSGSIWRRKSITVKNGSAVSFPLTTAASGA